MPEVGEELEVVSRALRQTDLSTTADVDAHLTSKRLENAATWIDRIPASRETAAG